MRVHHEEPRYVILLKLVSLDAQISQGCLGGPVNADPYPLRNLEGALSISKTEISASLRRSIAATLALKSNDRPKVNRGNLTEFVRHGLKYVFPPNRVRRNVALSPVLLHPCWKGSW